MDYDSPNDNPFADPFDPHSCLRSAWTLVKDNLGPAWVAGFAFLLVSSFSSNSSQDEEANALTYIIVLISLAVGLLFFFLSPFVMSGVFKLHQKWLQKDTSFFYSDVFDTKCAYGSILGARFIIGLLLLLLSLPAVAVGVVGAVTDSGPVMFAFAIVCLLFVPVATYVYLGLILTTRVVVFENLGALDAIKTSWAYAKGRRMSLLTFVIMQGVVALLAGFAGLLMLCVGIFLTVPLATTVNELAFTKAYLSLIQHKTSASPMIEPQGF